MISPRAGDVATYVKLLRIAMLLPVVLVIPLLFQPGSSEVSTRKTAFPPFLSGIRLVRCSSQYKCRSGRHRRSGKRHLAMVSRCGDRGAWYEDVFQTRFFGWLAAGLPDLCGDSLDRRRGFHGYKVRDLKSERSHIKAFEKAMSHVRSASSATELANRTPGRTMCPAAPARTTLLKVCWGRVAAHEQRGCCSLRFQQPASSWSELPLPSTRSRHRSTRG